MHGLRRTGLSHSARRMRSQPVAQVRPDRPRSGPPMTVRVRKAALLGAIPPFLLKTDDNPEGVDDKDFADIEAAIVNRPLCLLRELLEQLLQRRRPRGHPNQRPGLAGEVQCRGRLFTTRHLRVRRHLADRLPPGPRQDRRPGARPPRHRGSHPSFEATSARLPTLIADCTLVPVGRGPHAIAWAYPEEVNEALFNLSSTRRDSRPICPTLRQPASFADHVEKSQAGMDDSWSARTPLAEWTRRSPRRLGLEKGPVSQDGRTQIRYHRTYVRLRGGAQRCSAGSGQP